MTALDLQHLVDAIAAETLAMSNQEAWTAVRVKVEKAGLRNVGRTMKLVWARGCERKGELPKSIRMMAEKLPRLATRTAPAIRPTRSLQEFGGGAHDVLNNVRPHRR